VPITFRYSVDSGELVGCPSIKKEQLGLKIQALPMDRAKFAGWKILDQCGNDPSAGSPTETLLRLHLPLNDKV
jgi:hypothetical protein